MTNAAFPRSSSWSLKAEDAYIAFKMRAKRKTVLQAECHISVHSVTLGSSCPAHVENLKDCKACIYHSRAEMLCFDTLS